MIKVCPDPNCEAVFHNCAKNQTKCADCGGNIMKVNEETYWKKFSNNWFQYNTKTGEIFRPVKQIKQTYIDFA
jgi:hypothetical protein